MKPTFRYDWKLGQWYEKGQSFIFRLIDQKLSLACDDDVQKAIEHAWVTQDARIGCNNVTSIFSPQGRGGSNLS